MRPDPPNECGHCGHRRPAVERAVFDHEITPFRAAWHCRPPLLHFGHAYRKPRTGRTIESHRELIPPPPAAMGGVVAAAMDGAEVSRVVGAAVAFGYQMVGSVGAGLAADVADAAIPGDHRCRELAPGLSAIGAVDAVPPHPLDWCPARWAMGQRLPGHSNRMGANRFATNLRRITSEPLRPRYPPAPC